MPTDLLTRAGDDTTRIETYQVVQFLLDHFGPTLTAYLANSKSRSLPPRWAIPPGEHNHVSPREDVVRRLRTAHMIAMAIDEAESDHVTRSWFIASNPRLDGHTPAETLRDGDNRAVLLAAKAFLDDVYDA